MIAVLRQRNFALLWFGAFCAMLADWILFTALPIYVFQLTGSTLATSMVFVSSMLPRLALGSVAGVYVDRWDRRRVLIVCNLLLALALLPLLAFTAAERVWIALVVSCLLAAIHQFFGPAEHALLPRLVGEEHLVGANALNSLNNNLARLVGPVLGGFLAASGSLAGVVLVDVAIFLIAALLIALVKVSGRAMPPAASQAAPAARSLARLWAELRAGLQLIAASRQLRVIFVVVAVAMTGEGIMAVMFIVWIATMFGGGAQELGYFMAAQAIGGMLGGLVVGGAGRVLGTRRLLWLSAIIFGLIDLAIFNSPRFVAGPALGLALMVLVGIPVTGFGASIATIQQQSVEDAFRGRVFGVFNTVGALFFLLSTTLAGLVGGRLGPLLLLNIQGGAYIAAGLLVWLLLGGVTDRQPEPGAKQQSALPQR